ncbi:LysR family transcriptional regulator [Asticcacaulis excentricus]|nr:LysR family transcriptional regulator [Asticcacaulis excentricus]
MDRDELADLTAFVAVAEERSFTRAAIRLATSQSAVSQTVRRLEERLGVRLLTRNTRHVAPTEAGEHLLGTLRPAFSDIDATLVALGRFRDKPAGTIRLTAGRHAAETLLWPAISELMNQYPDINAEISVDSALTDIVSDRFDAGVRLGEQIEKDMIAVRIGPEMRMAVVASPEYLRAHEVPLTPHDLTRHKCINIRLPTKGGLYIWEFGRDGREINVRVEGRLVFNDVTFVLSAAINHYGIACVLEGQAQPMLQDGRLMRVLEDWCPPFAGYHLYYPSRRQMSPAFSLLVEKLKFRGKQG